MFVKLYVVYPDDPYMSPASFPSKRIAQAWADELCCSYWIDVQEVEVY